MTWATSGSRERVFVIMMGMMTQWYLMDKKNGGKQFSVVRFVGLGASSVLVGYVFGGFFYAQGMEHLALAASGFGSSFSIPIVTYLGTKVGEIMDKFIKK